MNATAQNAYDFRLIKAVIGLGNPGSKYYNNRHNIGFRVIDSLVEQLHASFRTQDNMLYAQIKLHEESSHQVYVIKPQTFMNNSGAVMSFLQKKGIKPNEILVVHDELEKDFGFVGFKFGGSHKGHNGLRSIMGVVGADFWRLRFGIGRPADREEVPNYVLANFPVAESARLPELIDQAVRLAQGTN
jgi:PTH1 family peptidyl-tRNA hydrolase